MPKIFGISYLRVIKRSEMKNIRLTFATVTVLSFCSGFINPIWAGKSDEKNFEISRNLDIFNSLFKELNMFYVDTINAEKAISDGVNAMLARLDPYTEYIPEKEKDDFFFSTTRENMRVSVLSLWSGIMPFTFRSRMRVCRLNWRVCVPEIKS